MAFHFSLAMVLRVRESAERREELNLQKVLGEIARVTAAIGIETKRIEEARKSRDAALQNPQPALAYELQSLARDAADAADRRKALHEQLGLLEQRRQAQMKLYDAAHRNRKMLSDMAARQREAWDLKQSRARQKVLDDIFAARSRLK